MQALAAFAFAFHIFLFCVIYISWLSSLCIFPRALKGCRELGRWQEAVAILADLLSELDTPGSVVFELALEVLAAHSQVSCLLSLSLLFFPMLNLNPETSNWFAMQCYAMLCYAMPCHAMLCYVKLCYVMPCYVMLCYAMPSFSICIFFSISLAC